MLFVSRSILRLQELRCYIEIMSDEQQQVDSPASPTGQIPGAEKKVLAGVLAIVLGSLGVHKFILGYQKEGIIMASCTVGGYILGIIG